MTKKTSLIFLTFCYSFLYGQTTKEKSIDSLMKTVNERGVFNGNIIVSEKGKIIYQSELGFSDYKKAKMLTSESSMPIGSIAKELSSTGIMILAEKGKLKLEDKISKYIPDLPKWTNEIQIKHLLQYTSGLPVIIKNTDTEYYEELNKLEKLNHTPGTGYIYSYANIYLQQQIIKKITHLSFPEFCKKYFFLPLKITSGQIPKDSTLLPNMAGSFDNDYKETTFSQGGGEMYFTVTDLYNWERNLHDKKIVNIKSLGMLSQRFDENSESGLGYAITDADKILRHSHHGSGNNYESFIEYKLENDVMVVLITNSQNFKCDAISEAIFNILEGKSYTVPKKSIYLDIRSKLAANFKNGISFYEDIKTNKKDKYDFTNEIADLINTGKYLMRRNLFDDAIKILHVSTLTNLKDTARISYACSLIAECYLKTDNKSMAVLYYKKAFELDPKNKIALNMLEETTGVKYQNH
jgi:CubicO group peptidase (beta-lactamase class C family)